MNYGSDKYYIVCYYPDIDFPSVCFRPTNITFEDLQGCIAWIGNHKKYFSKMVHFRIFSVDNAFDFIPEAKHFDGLK